MSPVLKDKVAIITGAGRGLGKEFALRFAKEGARLLLPDMPDDAFRIVRMVSSVEMQELFAGGPVHKDKIGHGGILDGLCVCKVDAAVSRHASPCAGSTLHQLVVAIQGSIIFKRKGGYESSPIVADTVQYGDPLFKD